MRVAVLGCLFLALVIFAVGLSALTVRAWDRALVRRADVRTAGAQVSDLRLAYSDQETGIRGYLLTGDADFLEPYREGTGLARAMLDRLRTATRETPELELDDQLDRVEQAAARWQQEVAQPALNDPEQPRDVVASRARFDALRAELDGLDEIVRDELAVSLQRTDDVKRNAFAVLVASAIAAVVAICLVAVLFRRWVTRPLAQIGEAARALSIDDSAALARAGRRHCGRRLLRPRLARPAPDVRRARRRDGTRGRGGTRRAQVEESAARSAAQPGEPGRGARLVVAREPQG
jgi:CHASE3 domain sensor protein